MIGADDLSDFFDPDEFGVIAEIVEPGWPAREVRGIEGAPSGSGRLSRPGVEQGASSLRVRPDQAQLQLASQDAPRDWRKAKLSIAGIEYSIVAVEPLGRLRSLLTLIPYGDRSAPAGERGKWQASN